MTALVTVRTDQDWTGFAVVIGILLVLAALAYLNAWRNDRRVERFDSDTEKAIDQALGLANEVDHIECQNDDCGVVLCYCKTPTLCEGAEEPGCGHTGGPFVCDRHRLAECFECREDARHDAGMTW